MGNIDTQEEIAQLKAEIAELKAVIEVLRAENERLRNGREKQPLNVKPNTHKEKRIQAKKARRRRAAEQNAGRKNAPANEVTQIRKHALEHCPECQYKLSGQSIARRRQVIDLPEMPALEVTEHQVIKRWCPKCQKWHQPKLDLSDEVLGQGRIGHRVASLVSWLRTQMRLPVKQLQSLLQHLYGLKLSVGGIVELTHAVAKAGQTAVAQIKKAILASPQLHMDETVWREDGDNGYVWSTSTPDGLRSYEFHFSRAATIPETLLMGYTGAVVTDFYAAYNHTDGQHQRCWVHLLRDVRQLKIDFGTSHSDILPWAAAVVQTYQDAKALAFRDPPLIPAQRRTAFDRLVERVEQLGLKWAKDKDHPAHALCKRLLRHSGELFLFVLRPGLAPDNNLAERAVRPLVIARKISGGTRSEPGSNTRMALQSLFATWAAQTKSALDECRAMLIAAPKPALP